MRRVVPLATIVLLASGVLAAPAGADTERCCFRIAVDAAGWLRTDGGTARWRWSTRQVARYVEHGRIFNALTRVPGRPPAPLARFALEGRPPCRARSGGFRTAPGAYASLEDTLSGRIGLVVRAGEAARRATRRCASARMAFPPGGPWAFQLDAPPGRTLREGGAFEVSSSWTVAAGAARVRVRFTYVPMRAIGTASGGER